MTRKIKCSISPMMRTALSIKRAKLTNNRKTKFRSACVSYYHPHVDESLEQAIYDLHPRFVIHWELQLNDEFRWHIYMHRSDGMLDDPTHVMLVADDKTLEYLPITTDTVNRLRLILLHNEDPVRFMRMMLDKSEENEQKRESALEKDVDDVSDYYRRLFARFAGGIGNPDSYWSPGISKKADGTYETGYGPKSRKVLTVVAGERRL